MAKGKQTRAKGWTFADLFAGIGGMRLGFEAAGGRCVFTSEWNPYSQKTYAANFESSHAIAGDITQIEVESVPDHDVLVGGFPCQPFSIAGVSKKNSLGNPHGFECRTQGTLFFEVARLIKAKQPRAFVLENVKNLASHDKGRTLAVILQTLRDELKYDVHYQVLDARSLVPQHRERIYIVGFRSPTEFEWPDLPSRAATSRQTSLPFGVRSSRDAGRTAEPQSNSVEQPRLGSILHPEDGSQAAELPFTTGRKAQVDAKYTLSDKLWQYLQDYAAKHAAKGNGFGFGLVGPDDVARTLSARYYKDGSEILIRQSRGRNPRRLTPRECARLMGFPDTFVIPVSDTQAYKQFGNSVAVPVVARIAECVADAIRVA